MAQGERDVQYSRPARDAFEGLPDSVGLSTDTGVSSDHTMLIAKYALYRSTVII